MTAPDPAREEADRAAAEAARIGGHTSSEPSGEESIHETERPLAEAGQGEAEGFEQAESELVEHASHSDEHAARRAIQDALPAETDDPRASEAGEADAEHSSECEEDAP